MSNQLDFFGRPLFENKGGLQVKFNAILLNLYDFAPEKDFNFINLQREIDKNDVFDHHPFQSKFENGLELKPHITLIYGLEHEHDFDEISKIIKNEPPIKLEIGLIKSFRNESKPYDVLVIEIISEDLNRIHWMIRNKFDTQNDFPNYKAHMTLAYIKKGTCKDLEGRSDWTGKEYSCSNLVFSNAGGEFKPMKTSEQVVQYEIRNNIKTYTPVDLVGRNIVNQFRGKNLAESFLICMEEVMTKTKDQKIKK